MGILSTSITGILTSQRALSVVSHNISNVNTPGYNRQVADLSTRVPQFSGVGFIGNGVDVVNVRRITDQFLTSQVRSNISLENEASTFLAFASQIDNMLADDRTGLSPAIENFFSAVQEVANLPSSTSSRQVMLSEAESLADRFRFLNQRLSDISNEVRLNMSADVGEINSLARAIGDMNSQVVIALGQSGGDELPNDLLDQRDQLIEKLSALVSVSTIEQEDGALNIFIGNGQPLVIGAEANDLAVSETYRGHFDITLNGKFSSAIITQNISGGSLGGMLNFHNQMLEPAQNSMGRLAITLADSFNNQHQLGITLDGDLNIPFFDSSTPLAAPLGTSLNNVSATITDPAALTTSNYQLIYNGADDYTLLRLSDKQITNINTGGSYPYTSPPIDGFTVNIASVAGAVSDAYVIQPTINGARDIDVLINDPRKIAAAAPLRSGEITNSAGLPLNSGNAEISPVAINSTTGLPLTAPVTLTFSSATNEFILSAPPGGTLAYDPASESAGKQFTVAAIGDATFTISGLPLDGDQFVIENNVNADGDNRNALSLASLQSAKILLNNTASYQDAYGKLIADVGTRTRQTEISHDALNALLTQSLETRESISGVNLEEEAANMLKFQQAYQAAAQIISVADRLFQSLINAVQ